MPIAYLKDGTPFLEPPYTQAEQDEIYRRYGEIKATLRSRPDKPQAPKR